MDRLLELTERAERVHFWFRGSRWFVRPELARATAGLSAPRLVDCGCGTGANLALLGEFGDAWGFDLTWQGLALARQTGRGRVARATVGAMPLPSEAFDVATSFDVFQCLPEPVEAGAIREMWRVLKPGGRILLTVAALDWLHGRHSALSEEVRRYTPGRLRALVEGAGFRIERLTFAYAAIFPLLLPLRLLQRLSNGQAPPPGELEITVPPAPVNAVLTAAVGLEALALRAVDMPIGSSLLCRARKPS